MQDNLADFEACPSSAAGESVCNSVYDMSTGEFSASCGVIACSGACVILFFARAPITFRKTNEDTTHSDCLNTIVNEVVTHEDECFNSDRGSIGIATVNGEASCGCSSVRFWPHACCTGTICPANPIACTGGRRCRLYRLRGAGQRQGDLHHHRPRLPRRRVRPRRPGRVRRRLRRGESSLFASSPAWPTERPTRFHRVQGYVLAPGGACTKVVKRDMMPIGAPAPINYASTSAHNGGSSSWHYGSSTAAPTTTSYHPHQAHTTSGAGSSSATTTSYSYKYHHGHSSSSSWVAPSGTQVPWVSRTSPSAGGGHSSSSSASWMSYSTMPAPPTSSGVNHNAHPTTTGDASSSSTMMPTTTSYSYNQWNGHSSNSHHNGGSASASASMMHWAHYNKRDAVPTAAPAYVYKQHNARAPANHHRRSSSGSPSASIPWGHHDSPSHSGSWMPSSSGGYGGSSSMMMPTTTPGGSNHYAHTTTTAPAEETTTSYSYKYHHHQSSSSPSGANGGSSSSGMASSSSMMNWVPAPSMGPSGSNHNAHNPSDSSSSTMMGSTTTTGAATTTTTGNMWYGSTTATPGPSQRAARRAADEFVFSDVCAQDERTCPGDDIMCVRLDDVTQCGGCHATGDAVNCLEIPGASSVSCLRGGCVVRSCQTGYFQTAEGRCERL